MIRALRTLAVLVAVAASSLFAAPQVAQASASGCTGVAAFSSSRVCIDVTGTGLYIKKINTTTRTNHSFCAYPIITITLPSGQEWERDSGRKQCEGITLVTHSWTIALGYNVPNNSKVCAWWTNHPKTKPCVTVHR